MDDVTEWLDVEADIEKLLQLSYIFEHKQAQVRDEGEKQI